MLTTVRPEDAALSRWSGLRVGCSGWGYEEWRGSFYPKEIEARDFLATYARVFDVVEIDSSFYRSPAPAQCVNWYRNTPAGFLFAAKLPQAITHERRLRDVAGQMAEFHTAMAELKEKCGPLCIQLPPGLTRTRDGDAFESLLPMLDDRFRYAVEFRHESWFVEETYALLRQHQVGLVWGTNQYLDTPTETTADFLYVRMIGDRSLTPDGTVQRDKTEDMRTWHRRVQAALGTTSAGFVFFNNHYAGFGPASVGQFRRMAGQPDVEFPVRPRSQQSLDSFG